MFESSTWAAALLDPNVSQKERLRRLLIRRLVRLRAELRGRELLAQSNPEGEAAATKAASAVPDQHGSHLDPAQETRDLETVAALFGWRVAYKGNHG
jgi:hypothetical protein